MKITAKTLYKRIRENISDDMALLGYKYVDDCVLAWCKPMGGKYFTASFQANKHGWEDDWGSSLMMEFQVSDESRVACGSMLKRERAPSLLSEEDLEAMREKNNLIIRTMNGFVQGKQIRIGDAEDAVVLLGKDICAKPYNPLHDPWFEYYAMTDVDFWSNFFIERIELFESIIAGSLPDRQ